MGEFLMDQPVLFICNHPGGVQAVLPVVLDLKKRNIPLYGVVSERASSAFAGMVEVFVLKEMVQKKFCEEILHKTQPQALVLGTSEPVDYVIGRMEAVFTNCARKKKFQQFLYLIIGVDILIDTVKPMNYFWMRCQTLFV